MRKIIVVGAGLAGLSLTWYALQKGCNVTVFDPKGVGGGASGASTGLLHPFLGKKAQFSWRGDEGMQATLELIAVAEKELGKSVASRSGVFRPAISEEQKIAFLLSQGSSAFWTTISLPGCPQMEGLWIPSGITVFSRLYLEGLWLACQRKGAKMIKEAWEENESEDEVILATGSATQQFPLCLHLPLRKVIGQSLLCRWKEPLPFSLASHGYVTLTEDPSLCQVGATYEHTKAPEAQKARELIDQVALFYQPARSFEIVEIRSGTRVGPKEGHQPIACQIAEKRWVLTGMGSRGMLYHSLMAQELIEKIFSPQKKWGEK